MIGPSVNLIKGGLESVLNTQKLNELRKNLYKDLLDGFTVEEKKSAELKLLQVERILLEEENAPRKRLSAIEGEIIKGMKDSVVSKREKLKEIQATQLDIANIMIEQQVFKKGVLDALSDIERMVSNHQISSGKSSFSSDVNQVQKNLEYIYNQTIKMSKHVEKLSLQLMEQDKKIEKQEMQYQSILNQMKMIYSEIESFKNK